MHSNQKLRVVLLSGGLSSESYLSRRSCEHLWEHFNGELYTKIMVDWRSDGSFCEYQPDSRSEIREEYPDILTFFSHFPGDLLFNLLHGEKENHGKLQGLLQISGIPYAGNSLETSVLGMNKLLSKRLFMYDQIPVPAYAVINSHRDRDLVDDTENIIRRLGLPCIIKPTLGGSSLGLCLINSCSELVNYISEFLPVHQEFLVEEFIDGQEYSSGAFGSKREDYFQPLTVVKMEYPGPVFDAKIKYDDTYKAIYPSGLPVKLEEQLEQISLRIHRSFGFEGPSRIDVRIRDGKPYVLEVNTQPGFSASSIFPQMLKQSGIALGTFLDRLIEWGVKRGSPL